MRDARPGIRELDRFARLAKLRVGITKVPCKLGWAENLSMSAVLRNVGALLADGKRLAGHRCVRVRKDVMNDIGLCEFDIRFCDAELVGYARVSEVPGRRRSGRQLGQKPLRLRSKAEHCGACLRRVIERLQIHLRLGCSESVRRAELDQQLISFCEYVFPVCQDNHLRVRLIDAVVAISARIGLLRWLVRAKADCNLRAPQSGRWYETAGDSRLEKCGPILRGLTLTYKLTM